MLGQVFYQSFAACWLPADVLLAALALPDWMGSLVSPSLASWPEGQPRSWLPVCTGDAAPEFCRENASSHPPFLTFLWQCDYL